MKKILTVILLFLLFPFNVNGINFNITSDYIYFYQLDKNELLYEKNMDKEISIASMTKIMTAYVAIENIDDLDRTIVMSNKDYSGLVEANASTAGFYVGETVTYRDLLYGLILPSGADAALALSNNIAGSEEEFVYLMNKKVEELGLKHTHFSNTTGLDEVNHYSSVEDVAKILLSALENPIFYEVFTTNNYTTSNDRLTFKSTLLKNSEIYKINIDYILGSKSGYTYDAGLCLASIAEFNGDKYLLITAGADYKSKLPNHIYDSNTIYKYFFEGYSYRKILTKGDLIVSIIDENGEYTSYYVPTTKEIYLENDIEITKKYIGVDLLTYDMKVGEKIGIYEVYLDGELVESITLTLENKVIKPFPLWKTIIILLIILFVISSICIFIKSRKKKKTIK